MGLVPGGQRHTAEIVSERVPGGHWLSSSAVRSGERLLQSQLDSAAARSAAAIRQQWAVRRSDVLMLATSEPVRATLASGADTAPPYARRAFATMPGIASVALRDAAGRVRWILGDPAGYVPSAADSRSAASGAAPMASTNLRIPMTDEAGRPLGDIDAHIRLDGLAAQLSTVEAAPSQFIAYRDRSTGALVGPSGVPAPAFNGGRFEWNEHRWMAVRESLDDPPLDIVAAAQLDPFLSPFTGTARVGAAALALSATLVVVLTIIVTARLTRSLGSLARAADRVSGGALESRVDVASQNEVGRVGRAFNTMLDNIARMMRELSQREAVAAMGELAATMAHQVRSPATAMRIDVERAYEKLPLDAPERVLLARALGQLDRLERAVTGSLRAVRGASAEFTDLDLREPLDRAIAGVRREHAPRAVTVDTTRVPPPPLRVRGDVASLEQLFGNVLANAAQASRDGGCVRVSIDATCDSQFSVTIRDDGAGMTSDVLARAGEPLFSTKPWGTGLGLSIAQRIAAAHGGVISIESARGNGTTVAIHLPRATVVTS